MLGPYISAASASPARSGACASRDTTSLQAGFGEAWEGRQGGRAWSVAQHGAAEGPQLQGTNQRAVAAAART